MMMHDFVAQILYIVRESRARDCQLTASW